MDLLQLLQGKVDPASIKRVSGRQGGENHSPCPLCGGKDRFAVFPEQAGGELCQKHGINGTWSCPRGCGKGGDVISWFTEVEGMTFSAACAELKIPLEGQEKQRRGYRPLRMPRQDQKAAFSPTSYAPPLEQWRLQATKLATEAHTRLLESPAMLRYLSGRGLPEAAVRAYRLGYIEAEGKQTDCIFRARAAFGLPEKKGPKGQIVRAFRIPRGITIPVWSDDQCLRIRIRRRDADRDRSNPKDPKYLLVPQPGQPYSAPLMLPPVNISPDLSTWVVVEAEMDAMAIHHACGGTVGVLSILTVRVKPIRRRMRLCHGRRGFWWHLMSTRTRPTAAIPARTPGPGGRRPIRKPSCGRFLKARIQAKPILWGSTSLHGCMSVPRCT